MAKARRQSQRARQDANLDRLNGFGSEKGEFDMEDVLNNAELAMGETIKRIHANLDSEDAIFTGEIADIRIEKDGADLVITAPRHLLYQDKGVNGSEVQLYDTPYAYKDKRPPIESLQAWADAKGVNVYYLQDKIFKEGIPPQNVYSKELPQLADDIANAIADGIALNIIENI